MKTLTVQRPWGHFDQFTKNESVTVKVHSVNPDSAMSMQYHNHREEFWKVLSGSAFFTIGDKTVEGNIDDEFTVPVGIKHRVETKNSPAQLLEISYGDFDEEDIVRVEDKYGRA
jgi:mannose-6-phosphate isomerase